MRENDIGVVRFVCTVQDPLLTYPKPSGERQQFYKPKSSIALPSKLRRLKKNEAKVMKLSVSTSDTDINTAKRPHLPGTGPGRTNNSIRIDYRASYRPNIRSVTLRAATRDPAISPFESDLRGSDR